MSRRAFLGLTGGTAAAVALGGGALAYSRNRFLTSPTFSDYPFSLGVASGEPRYGRSAANLTLWTRLAPDPLNGGGMPRNDVEVRWEIAEDENFSKVVQSGTEIAPALEAHSVHVALRGLEPARYYWYRFKAGDEISRTGRTKTAPEAGAPLDSMSFAFASCSDFQEGYFPVYRAIAEDEDLDVVFHLGDYIYEYAPDPEATRVGQTDGPTDLMSYRNTYAEYRLDPALQDAHAMHPFEVIPDDHEVYNNFEGDPEWSTDGGACPPSLLGAHAIKAQCISLFRRGGGPAAPLPHHQLRGPRSFCRARYPPVPEGARRTRGRTGKKRGQIR